MWESNRVKDVCREHGISEGTYYRWKGRHGGMDINEARRLKDLEQENRRLKAALAEVTLEKQALKGGPDKKMVTPAARRAAAEFFRDELHLSERIACRLSSFSRSSLRRQQQRELDDRPLVRRLRELASERPRFGYRRLHVLLCREGWEVNRKRVYRLYRQQGLAVRRKKRKTVSRANRRPRTRVTESAG